MLGKAMAGLGYLAMPGVMAWSAYSDYNMKKQEGWDPTLAGTYAVGTQAFYAMLSPWAFGGIMAAGAVSSLTQSTIQGMYGMNNQTYQARMPFSQRFEHTDVTLKMQSMGLRAIGASWAHSSMGMEAGVFAQRYGRG